MSARAWRWSRGSLLCVAMSCGSAELGTPPSAATSHAEQPQHLERAAHAAAEPVVCDGSCNHGGPTPEPEGALASFPTRELTKIADPSQVCMVRNHFMGRPQLTAAVSGATYFGCCEGCRNRLLSDPNARVAVDPVSRRAIDKAFAVMAHNARGNVFYFESDQNLAAYQAGVD
ncbi:MAG: hypothetical protein RL701_5769 [Pseudomonadota bacterium]